MAKRSKISSNSRLLPRHLRVDGEEALGAAVDLRRDAGALSSWRGGAGLLDEALALLALAVRRARPIPCTGSGAASGRRGPPAPTSPRGYPSGERSGRRCRASRLGDLLVRGDRASVRMLWSRSASFTRMTRMSLAIASASSGSSRRGPSREWSDAGILVTPSMMRATSGPNAASISSSEAWCPRRCRAAARRQRLGVETDARADLRDADGWAMKSSPDWRRWSAWCSQEKRNAPTTSSRSTFWATSSACSSTIANRSPSSSPSSRLKSAGACSAAPSRWLRASTGRCEVN